MSTVCAMSGCPETVPSNEVAYRRGFCSKHTGEALIEAIENLGGYLEQLADQAARIAAALEDRPGDDPPRRTSRDW